MFLQGNTTKENKTTSLYEVEDTITFQLGENNFTSKATYDLHWGKSSQYSNQIILNRSNFKIDDKEVEKKFPKISNLYFSSLFPLWLTYHEGNYRVAQFNDIAKRMMENDLTIRNNFSGDGLDYIRKQFMEKVKNQTALQNFLELLPLYQIINISTAPKFKKETIPFQWNLAGLGPIACVGDFKLDSVDNKMLTTLQYTNEALLMEMIEKYSFDNEIQISFDENDFIEATFKLETQYNESLTAILESTAEIKISMGDKFNYKQNFNLTLSPANN
jgi:hypothetical protein